MVPDLGEDDGDDEDKKGADAAESIPDDQDLPDVDFHDDAADRDFEGETASTTDLEMPPAPTAGTVEEPHAPTTPTVDEPTPTATSGACGSAPPMRGVEQACGSAPPTTFQSHSGALSERANRSAALWMSDKLRAVILSMAFDRRPRGAIRVALCTTVFRRSHQFQDALPLNLDLLRPWQDTLSWYVAIFQDPDGEGAALVAWVLATFQDELRSGFLVLGAPFMRYWHCPVAKNTAHVFAVSFEQEVEDLSKVMLVNLDCDNLVGPNFVQSLLDVVSEKGVTRGLLIDWHGSDAGLTGRMCQSAATLKEINGFDEDLMPSGYQDIDIRNRVCALAKQLTGSTLVRHVRDVTATGGAIPNDPGNLKNSLGAAKVRFVDPRHAGMSWGAMNTLSTTIARRKSGVLRNQGREFASLGVACPRVKAGDLGPAPSEPQQQACSSAPPPAPAAESQPAPAAESQASSSAPPPLPPKPSRPPPRPPSPPAPPPPAPPPPPRPAPAPVPPPPSRPRQASASVASCGLEVLPLLHPTTPRIRSSATAAAILRFIRQVCLAIGRDQPNISLDCRPFTDPNRPRGGVNHIGTHPNNMEQFVWHPRFEPWIQETKRLIYQVLRVGGTPCIMTFCNKGRHRSVSAARIVVECLLADNVRISSLEHLSENLWHRGTCDNCIECRTPHTRRDAALARALQAWASA